MTTNDIEPSKAHQLVDAVDYLSDSVVIRSIIEKKTGTVSLSSFDTGQKLATKISPFDRLIQVIDGTAEVVIDGHATLLETGQLMIIPAHSSNSIKAHVRFKILSTIIKSGYEDISV
ncbi:hypothetical protein SAMN04488028_11012 [Reichenbachiella agariperforans]|uniref:Cupin n=1 Tax=Reichenbachiella agariperforans TaxID=156994 RepID=A0A1M6VVC5_REIAG|nr:cupin domain-containing protein [Reichenbachiella agariperforans]SHK85381.1 hypothetical protein SAMN04488028_11012 [Reichenbachiella agariperforans]